jgi:hypothetical protein
MPGNSGEEEGSGDSGVIPTAGSSKDDIKRLDQVIQVGNEFMFDGSALILA